MAAFSGFGIYGIFESYNLARLEGVSPVVSLIFWLSYFSLTLPMVLIIIAPDSKFWSRISSLMGFALATMFPKLFRSTESPIYGDEFGHLAAVTDILEKGQVDWWNSIVNPVVDFSVLHYLAAFIVETTGLELWTTANALVAIVHVLTMLGVFSLLRIKFSPRAAAAGALIYAANPNWMFFHTRFAYETLALLFTVWALFFIVRALESPGGQRALMIIVSGPILFALSQTNHISFIITLILISVYVGIVALRSFKEDVLLLWTSLGTLVWVGVWSLPNLMNYSSVLVEYITYSLNRSTRSNLPFLMEAIGINTSESVEDVLLVSESYSELPFFEQFAGLIVPFILLAIMIFFWAGEIKKHGSFKIAAKAQTNIIILANILSILYFLSLTLIFNEEYTLLRRSWTYTILGFAILFGATYERYLLSVPKSQRGRPPKWKQVNTIVVIGFIILSISSLANGATASQRYPIQEGVVGFSSSKNLNPELQELAIWSKNTLPENAWIITDRYTKNALVYPGGLRVAPLDTDRFPYWQLFLNPQEPPTNIMKSAEALGVDYIVLNKFTFKAPTAYGYWFHPDEKEDYAGSRVVESENSIAQYLGSSPWTETVWASETYVVYRILWGQYNKPVLELNQ